MRRTYLNVYREAGHWHRTPTGDRWIQYDVDIYGNPTTREIQPAYNIGGNTPLIPLDQAVRAFRRALRRPLRSGVDQTIDAILGE